MAPAGAGYSGTPLAKKLGIKEHARVAVLRAPDDFEDALGTLPEGAEVSAGLPRGKTELDVVVLFVKARSELTRDYEKVAKRLTDAGGLWVAWPKRASGIATDVTEDVVRAVCLPSGLVDNKVCAIDDTWSGLRLVWRREKRATRPRG